MKQKVWWRVPADRSLAELSLGASRRDNFPKVAYNSPMSPQAALDCQIARYREMTGEERLAIALSLHEFACDIAREGIRAQHPAASEEEVGRLLRRRLELARAK